MYKNSVCVLLASFIAFAFGCAGKNKEVASPVIEKNYFAEAKGCFLLYNMKTHTFEKILGDEICKERFPACSTFKVPLAVMAFDSGVLKDENVVLKWDGKKGVLPEHNKDHNAKTWMKESVVWFSQRLTPKMGKPKLQKYLHDFHYGNENLADGITQAWLTSPSKREGALNISAYEQIEFMKKLWTDKLPASPRALQLARDVTYLETSPLGFKMNGKTGSNFFDRERKIQFGWFISHIQNGDKEYLTATNISDLAPNKTAGYGGPRAKQITKDILKDQGLW